MNEATVFHAIIDYGGTITCTLPNGSETVIRTHAELTQFLVVSEELLNGGLEHVEQYSQT